MRIKNRQKFSEIDEKDDMRILKMMEKIRSCINSYREDSSTNIELTKRLYGDLKVYYKNDFDNILLSSIELLKVESKNLEERDLIEKFEQEIEKIRTQEEKKKERKAEKSEQRADRKRKQREVRLENNELIKRRNAQRKYGGFEFE